MLEIPSGVWADTVSRRALLVLAPLLSGAGYALWIAAPSYPAFAAGFVLWGAQGALQSGALEALVYEELDRAGQARRYASVIGRATALGTIASAAAMGLAAPVLAMGGFTAVGVASVAVCVAAALVATTFPEHRTPAATERDDQEEEERSAGAPGYAAVLRTGIAEVRASRAVRAALLLVVGVTAVWGSLDEYLPLLAVDAGVATEDVPLLGLLVYAGVALGGVLAGRASLLGRAPFAALLLAAAAALAAGALTRSVAGFALVAVAFAAFQALTIAADARLQDAMDGGARSTVTSLAGLATEVAVIAVFATYALGSAAASHAALFAAFAALYGAVALAVAISPERLGRPARPRRAPGR